MIQWKDLYIEKRTMASRDPWKRLRGRWVLGYPARGKIHYYTGKRPTTNLSMARSWKSEETAKVATRYMHSKRHHYYKPYPVSDVEIFLLSIKQFGVRPGQL